MKKIGILGSTGSVGTQALEIIKKNPDKFKVKYLSCNSNSSLLVKQAKFFKPDYICLVDSTKKDYLKNNLSNVKIMYGQDALEELSKDNSPDIVLNAVSGYQGLTLTVNSIIAGNDIALANKESIVQAGKIVTELARVKGVNILPVDSEHSALWQCLNGEKKEFIKRLILTASGGPFRKLKKKEFKNITKKDALNHPNWSMGNKITIDSATMMNKGFEVIEAFWLFNISLKKIDIVVHPQSLIHSMIEFIDGSIKAQISIPDMRLPILYALSYPERIKLNNMEYDFNLFQRMDFEPADLSKFKCIKLAYDAIKLGETYPTVLNVSNDIAVRLFLKEKISFIEIPELIDKAMNKHIPINNPSLENILEITKWTEKYLERYN